MYTPARAKEVLLIEIYEPSPGKVKCEKKNLFLPKKTKKNDIREMKSKETHCEYLQSNTRMLPGERFAEDGQQQAQKNEH